MSDHIIEIISPGLIRDDYISISGFWDLLQVLSSCLGFYKWLVIKKQVSTWEFKTRRVIKNRNMGWNETWVEIKCWNCPHNRFQAAWIAFFFCIACSWYVWYEPLFCSNPFSVDLPVFWQDFGLIKIERVTMLYWVKCNSWASLQVFKFTHVLWNLFDRFLCAWILAVRARYVSPT